jgi:hypothetical protein
MHIVVFSPDSLNGYRENGFSPPVIPFIKVRAALYCKNQINSTIYNTM